MKKILLVGLICCSKAFASDFGVIGKTYPIKENDLIVAMQKRMAEKVKNGEFKAEIDKMKQRSQQYVARPKGVKLPVATKYAAVRIDAQYRVPNDIKDANGRTLYKAGTIVNPLEIYPIRKGFCFIDGDDKKQVTWAKKACYPDNKIVLINGNYLDVAKETKLRIYFDQQQKLISRFNITAVPTVIRQSGNALVKEVFPIEK